MKDVKANVCPDPSPFRTPSATTQSAVQSDDDQAGRRRLLVRARQLQERGRGVPEQDRRSSRRRAARTSTCACIEEIARQIPNKPIRYLVNSHQHFDAAAGLRAYFAHRRDRRHVSGKNVDSTATTSSTTPRGP